MWCLCPHCQEGGAQFWGKKTEKADWAIQAQALWRPEQYHLPGGEFMVVFSLTQDEWFSYPVYNFTELRKKLDSETVCNFRKGIIIQLGYILI